MVGLTGGIGAGKSTVARRLAGLGAVVVDADQVARSVVATGTDGFAEVVAAFGEQVVDPSGGLDRPALARLVFADEEARRALEGIIHPRVRAVAARIVAESPADAVVVQDIPLLAENGLAPSFHLVLVVEVPLEVRLSRLAGRGVAVAEARARMSAQAGDVQRRAVADVLLDNSGSVSSLNAAVGALWDGRIRPFEENLRMRRPAPLPRRRVPYDPSWPAQYERLAARIAAAVGERVSQVRHVGPTSAPGTAAPDVIDIELVATVPPDALREPLESAGFPQLASADPARPARIHFAGG